MRKFAAPRHIPEGPNFPSFLLSRGGGEPEVHHWRIPRPSTCTRLIRLAAEAGGIRRSIDEAQGVDKVTALSEWQEAQESVEGLVVGVCWYHRELDLNVDGGMDVETGDRVYEVLHAAGYTAAEITYCAGRLMALVSRGTVPSEEEAKKLANFS